MNEWDVLQIEQTTDLSVIRKAYASLIKQYKPHTHPESFKKIRAAYEGVIKLIEYDILSENDNDSNSIFPTVEQTNHELVPIDSLERIQHPEIPKFYIEHIMELYADLETRNNVEVWQAAMQRNSIELLMDGRSFDSILAHIIKSEYLYHSDLLFKPEMYILLFDFFNVDEGSYIPNTYNKYISTPLLKMLSEHRYDLRLASVQESDFNLKSPVTQIRAENYYANVILNSSDLINGNIKKLSEYLRNGDPTYIEVLGNVVFKDILDKYIGSTTQNNVVLVARLYELFRFKHKNRLFYKIFVQMGYSKEDIKNCLDFSRQLYISSLPPLYYRIIIAIPPLTFIFGLFFLSYRFLKECYFMLFPNKDNKNESNVKNS